MVKNKKLIFALVIYCILFYSIWTLFEFLVKNSLFSMTGNNDFIMQIIRSGIIKNLVWTMPALILIRYFEDDMYIGLKEMFISKVNVLKCIPVFVLCALCVLIGVLKRGELSISPNFTASQIIVVLFVGITEETVFRGWLLNSTLKNADTELKQWIAVIINAVMFLVIHFPVWIHSKVFFTNFQSFAFIGIIVLSAIFSCLFIKTKNILVPISLHMFYDLLVFMFIE